MDLIQYKLVVCIFVCVGVGPCYGQGGLGGCSLQGYHGGTHAHCQMLASEL